MHVHYLHWLMSVGLLIHSALFNHVNPLLVTRRLWSAPIWQCALSVHICLVLVVEYWPLWVNVQVIATLKFTIVSSCFFI